MFADDSWTLHSQRRERCIGSTDGAVLILPVYQHLVDYPFPVVLPHVHGHKYDYHQRDPSCKANEACFPITVERITIVVIEAVTIMVVVVIVVRIIIIGKAVQSDEVHCYRSGDECTVYHE